MRIRVPSDGSVGGTPTPRNDKVASVMMAVAMWIVAITSTGPSTLGSTWRHHDRQRVHADQPRRLHVFLVASRPAWSRAPCARTAPSRRCRSRRSARRTPALSCAFGSTARGDAVDQQRDQDRRERQLHVGDAHDEGVDAAADDSRRAARAPTPSTIDSSTARDADQQRDARAEDDRRQDVAALVVGAEREGRVAAVGSHAGGVQRVQQVERWQVERVVRRDPGRERGAADADERTPRRRRSRTANAGSCSQRSLSAAERAARPPDGSPAQCSLGAPRRSMRRRGSTT